MNKTSTYYKDLIKKHFLTFLISFLFIFSLVLLYAYFANKVYQADGSIEVVKYKENTNLSNNPLQIATKESTPEDEAEILKSNLLVNKTIKELGLNIEYYDFYRNKNHSVEKEEFPLIITTFIVKDSLINGKNIQINQIDNDSYKLTINTASLIGKIKGSKILNFSETFKYGKTYTNDLFTIQIDKKEKASK
ncbi:hypothetical protein KKG81_13785 [bacterium]|nr:hypothetical protein [bacterium]